MVITKKRRPRSRWSELPTELLELIMKKLASVDILRFEAVCSCWNQAAKSYISAPYFTLDIPQTPWLMIPGGEENHVHTRRFFNLAEFKYYTIKNALGDIPDAWCVGSSHGWLVLTEEKGTACLLNPFSGDRIELPSIWTLHPVISKDYIAKAVTSSKPPSSSSSSDFVVAIILYSNTWITQLAFHRHGDDAWTGFGQKGTVYHDGMFHSTSGHFFALATDCSVEVWDLRKCFPIKTLHLQPFRHRQLNNDDDFKFDIQNYLVESLGEILLVRRFIVTKIFYHKALPDVIRPYRTSHFYIYRQKSTSLGFEWEKVESLHNRAVFLGGNHSMSLSSRNFPECEENSIYFTDHRWEMNPNKCLSGKKRIGCGGHDLGVYNVKDNIMKPMPCYLTFDRWIINPPPFWIVPDIIHGFGNGS
ncbi:putative F-box protein At4g17565 [Rosa rugosa]|uniref:putative F-box protein At4g17565 n=1 Tax=Rosa rugosa TaxID=74645 RepID=UPI002B410C8B|nr:putative F-box protein At4g17565 [Rosa rugosa]